METTKSRLRKQLRAARKSQKDRPATSREVLDRLMEIPAFQAATAIGWYIDAGSEVTTRDRLQSSLADEYSSQCHAAPFCDDDDLAFFPLRSWSDLELGEFNILAPSSKLRSVSHAVPAESFDVVLVPAVGFDLQGNRLGQGKGFYDRFLTQVRTDALKIGLAFDCQVVDGIPSEPHDVQVDLVVTESRVIVVGE